MASIFFTDRLPGTSLFQTLQVWFHVARDAELVRLFVLAGSGDTHKKPLSTIILSRLPQKQGLCQVVDVPDFETLSDF
jgi:hypothetical protein